MLVPVLELKEYRGDQDTLRAESSAQASKCKNSLVSSSRLSIVKRNSELKEELKEIIVGRLSCSLRRKKRSVPNILLVSIYLNKFAIIFIIYLCEELCSGSIS